MSGEDSPGSGPNPSAETADGGAGAGPRRNERAAGARSVGSPPVDFTTLILSLHEAALQSMGAKDAEVEVDLDAAHYEIDLLAMLQDKTSGNLSDDEDRLLRTILYELRTAYVRVRDSRDRS